MAISGRNRITDQFAHNKKTTIALPWFDSRFPIVSSNPYIETELKASSLKISSHFFFVQIAKYQFIAYKKKVIEYSPR